MTFTSQNRYPAFTSTARCEWCSLIDNNDGNTVVHDDVCVVLLMMMWDDDDRDAAINYERMKKRGEIAPTLNKGVIKKMKSRLVCIKP